VFIIDVKAAVAYQEFPASVPLGGPRLGEASQRLIIGDLNGVSLDHHVESLSPLVAASRQNHKKKLLLIVRDAALERWSSGHRARRVAPLKKYSMRILKRTSSILLFLPRKAAAEHDKT